PARFERHDVALPAQDELADTDLAGVLKRLLADDIALLGRVAVGTEIVSPTVEARGDSRGIDESHKLDGLLRFELQLIDLFLIEQDVFALLIFVALGDFLVLDRAD